MALLNLVRLHEERLGRRDLVFGSAAHEVGERDFARSEDSLHIAVRRRVDAELPTHLGRWRRAAGDLS